MKKLTLAFLITFISMINNLQAQRIVWQDDFETSKGWSEYEDKYGSAAVIDGVLKLKGKEDCVFISKCKTNLDGNKNFEITMDVNVRGGLRQDRYIGLVFDYKDNKNYKCFYVEKGFVWFDEYKDGKLIRQDKEYLKNRTRSESKQLTFKLIRKGQTALFLVNDEETLDMDSIDVHSNRIAVLVAGDQEVSFDNVKILQ